MTEAVIIGLATGVPTRSYDQSELCRRLIPFFDSDPQICAILERNGIERRHTVVDLDYYNEGYHVRQRMPESKK